MCIRDRVGADRNFINDIDKETAGLLGNILQANLVISEGRGLSEEDLKLVKEAFALNNPEDWKTFLSDKEKIARHSLVLRRVQKDARILTESNFPGGSVKFAKGKPLISFNKEEAVSTPKKIRDSFRALDSEGSSSGDVISTRKFDPKKDSSIRAQVARVSPDKDDLRVPVSKGSRLAERNIASLGKDLENPDNVRDLKVVKGEVNRLLAAAPAGSAARTSYLSAFNQVSDLLAKADRLSKGKKSKQDKDEERAKQASSVDLDSTGGI